MVSLLLLLLWAGVATAFTPPTVTWLSNDTDPAVPPTLLRAVSGPACAATLTAGQTHTDQAIYVGGSGDSGTLTARFNLATASSAFRAYVSKPAQALPDGRQSFGFFTTEDITNTTGSFVVWSGLDGPYIASNDVWTSSNALPWTLLCASPPWSPRYNFSYTSVRGVGNMRIGIMYGGFGADGTVLGDMWQIDLSSNTVFTALNPPPLAAARQNPGLSTFAIGDYDGWLVFLGGRKGSGHGGNGWVYFNDVWFSTDKGGDGWVRITAAAVFSARYAPNVWSGGLSDQAELYLYGGVGRSGSAPNSEVFLTDLWYSSDSGNEWWSITPVNPQFGPAFSILGCTMVAFRNSTTIELIGLGTSSRNASSRTMAVGQVVYA